MIKPDWDYPEPFLQSFTVEAAHVDELLHTNNTAYIKWCERCAWAHSNALGMDIALYRRLNRGMAIRSSEWQYELATGEGDKLWVATWIVNWDGKLGMSRKFQVLREQDQRTVLRGSMHFLCIELDSGKLRRMPREFIEGYGPAVLNTN